MTVAEEAWRELSSEDRIVARAEATSRKFRRGSRVFSHSTAAAIWGLPLFDHWPSRIDVVTDPEKPTRSTSTVMRHPLTVRPEDVETVGGLRVTGLDRTVRDIAMTESAEVAIGCADAAVRRRIDWTGDVPDQVARWTLGQFAELESARGRPGVAGARRVIGMVDPRSESVLESVSRLHLHRLGVAHVPQVPVPGLGGRHYRVDFEFTLQDAYGEVDGAIKYGPRSRAQELVPRSALISEKEREDEIRGVTGKRIVRWGYRDLRDPYAFGERLAACGIHVPALHRRVLHPTTRR